MATKTDASHAVVIINVVQMQSVKPAAKSITPILSAEAVFALSVAAESQGIANKKFPVRFVGRIT